MAVDLSGILELNRRLVADMEKRAALVRQREDKARSVLDECQRELRDIEARRAALAQTESMYREAFGRDERAAFIAGIDMAGVDLSSTADSPLSAEARSKPRARIGDQRYLMFDALRSNGRLGLEGLMANTGLGLKRVKDQMTADVQSGMVREEVGQYELTPDGLDLLIRFESYKKARNEPLPTVAKVAADATFSELYDEPDHSLDDSGEPVDPKIAGEEPHDVFE